MPRRIPRDPGAKTYIYTLYALSALPQINVPPAQVSRDVLLAAMKDRILATAELQVVYSRPEGATDQAGATRAGPARQGRHWRRTTSRRATTRPRRRPPAPARK